MPYLFSARIHSFPTILVFLFALLSATSCAPRLIGRIPIARTSPAVILELTVEKTYPQNANWNDYVKRDDFTGDGSNPKLNWHVQDDVACDGTETGDFTACIHGGEKRKIELASLSSCTGITATDTLGAFHWTCEIIGTTPTVLLQGLKDTHGLKDLVDATAWKGIGVNVYRDGTLYGQTEETVWWENTVLALPDSDGTGVQTLTNGGETAGRVYTLSAAPGSTVDSDGYNLNDDRIAITTLGDAVLRFSNAGSSCHRNTGETTAADRSVLICSGSQKFLWIEGNFQMDPTAGSESQAIRWAIVSFSTIRNVSISDVPSSGDGITLMNAASIYNHLKNVTVANSASNGIGTFQARSTQFSNVRLSNIGAIGVSLGGVSNNHVFHNVVVTSSNNGITLGTGTQNGLITFSHMTFANLSSNALNLTRDLYASTVNQVLFTNSQRGLTLADGNGDIISQVASINNDVGVYLNANRNGHFTNNLLVGSNATADCVVANSTGFDPGLVDLTCAQQGASDHNLLTGNDLTGSFVGKVTLEDATNASNSNGGELYDSIADWVNFSNSFRSWGIEGLLAFPDTGHRGRCTTGVNCRIWDFRLLEAISVVRNRSGDGTNPNGVFTAGATCPAEVDGNRVLTDTSSRVFLVNAQEILGDSIGNENGLCETGESCIYSPNFGAYQGEGDWSAAGKCVFQNGTVTDVDMYAYPQNGAE